MNARGLLFVGLFASVLGCGSGNSPPTPARPVVQRPRVNPQPPAVNLPRGSAQVVVDISQSNRGFAQGITLLKLYERVVNSALSELHLNTPLQYCTLDDSLHCPATVTPQTLSQGATYNGRSAALDALFCRPAPAARSDQQLPDPMDPFAVTVLVTDGMRSSPPAPAAGQPAPEARLCRGVTCNPGADPHCVAELLAQRAAGDRYGLWAIRLLLPFSGRYFAEGRLDRTDFGRIDTHLRDLNRAAEWDRSPPFRASRPNLNDGTFQFDGTRPLMIYVMARDPALGRRVRDTLLSRLEIEQLTIRQDTRRDVQHAEWGPFAGFSGRFVNVVRANSGGPADEVRMQGTPTVSGSTVQAQATCTLQGQATLRVTGVLAQGTIPPPSFASVRVMVRPQQMVPWAQVPVTQVNPGGFSLEIPVDCRTLAEGTHTLQLQLWAEWTVDRSALEQQWFIRESAQTPYSAPELVFGLDVLGRTVINRTVPRAGALSTLVLRVVRTR